MNSEKTNIIPVEYLEFYDKEIMGLEGVYLSASGDVIIPVEHFGKFPWYKLNMKDSNTSSLSAGGHPLHDYQWTINFWLTGPDGQFHPMVKQYRWVIPEGLVGLMDWCRECATEKLQTQLRHLLGVD